MSWVKEAAHSTIVHATCRMRVITRGQASPRQSNWNSVNRVTWPVHYPKVHKHGIRTYENSVDAVLSPRRPATLVRCSAQSIYELLSSIMFATQSLLTTFIAFNLAAVNVVASPLFRRDVIAPRITSPTADSVWPVGSVQTVTWYVYCWSDIFVFSLNWQLTFGIRFTGTRLTFLHLRKSRILSDKSS